MNRTSAKWRYLVVAGWFLALLGLWLYPRGRGGSPTALLGEALDALRGDPLAPLWLLLVYLVRPLVLLPVTLLTVAAGMLFGALWGTLYAAAGALLSSSVAYACGQLFGQNFASHGQSGWRKRLAERPFDTVLICRFLGVPGDLVNYAAGYLRISFAAFVGATLLGGAPGILAATLAGSSLASVTEAKFNLRWPYLVASAALLLLGLGVSWVVRRCSSLTGPDGEQSPEPE